jgi:hypothetical protein
MFDCSFSRFGIKQYLYCALWSVTLILACSPWSKGDKNYSNDRTATDLESLADIVLRVYNQRGSELFTYHDQFVDSLLVRWQTEGLVSLEACNDFKEDLYGRKYRWIVSEMEKTTYIRILSDGKNGVYENGGGDDIFVEIRIPNNGSVEVWTRAVTFEGNGLFKRRIGSLEQNDGSTHAADPHGLRALRSPSRGTAVENTIYFLPSSSLATAVTRSGSKPNFFCSSLSGAEAPNVFIPITRPAVPT